MAEEFNENENKTEEPTQKRLEEALKRGDVVKSQEVNTWFVVAGGALVLMAFSGTMGKDLSAIMRGLIANAHDISVDGPALPRLFQKLGGEMIAAIAIPFLRADAGGARWKRNSAPAGVVVRGAGAQAFTDIAGGRPQAHHLQTGPCQSRQGPHQVNPDRRRADRTDVARAWTTRGAYTQRPVSHFTAVPFLDLPLSLSLTLKLLGSVVAMLAVVAAADYLFQYRQWHERQKMSLRELKEEFKQTEGDPAIKAR